MKDLGEAKRILGINIIRDRKNRLLYLSQADYISKILDKFSMTNAKPSDIPLGGHLLLTSKDCPKTDQGKEEMQNIPYDMAVGSIMYLMICTRPDLAFPISLLSRFMSNPGLPHWLAMKYLFRYLIGTKNLGLIYGNHVKNNQLTGFVDADFGTNKDSRKSITAMYFTWAGNCISWKSQQQSIVALSSTEAEYIAAVEGIKEAIWLKGIFKELQGINYIPTLYMDSQSALYLCKDPVYHERTKHIDVRFHFIRDKLEAKVVEVKKIAGEKNPADFGTKILPAGKFLFCRQELNIGKVT